MLAERLKEVRLARGLTQEALIEKMNGVITKQAYSKYERAKAEPSPGILVKLSEALDIKVANLYEEPEWNISFIAFRKIASVGKKEQVYIRNYMKEALLNRIRLQELTNSLKEIDFLQDRRPVKKLVDVEGCAEKLRENWNLGSDPIRDLREVLEDHSVFTFEFDTRNRIDGGSLLAKDQSDNVIAVGVCSRTGICGERQRLNYAHELGHVFLDIDEGVDEEKAAMRFGAAFLAPEDTVKSEVGTRRTNITYEELSLLKGKFGISKSALLFRLYDLGIITESHRNYWFRFLKMNNEWKKAPDESAPETSDWAKQHAFRAYAEGLVTLEEAERLSGSKLKIREESSNIRNIMKSPPEERRKLMAESAERLVDYYEDDEKWRDFQGGKLAEY